MRLLLLWLPLALPLASCQDSKVAVYNTEPVVAILAPSGGSVFTEGEIVEFHGTAVDDQDPSEALALAWVSDKDGEIGLTNADSTGSAYLAIADLSVNVHTITFTAVDSEGESASTAVSIQIDPEVVDPNEGVPTAILTSPAEGSTFYVRDVVTLVGAVSDLEQARDTLVASLVSDLDGTLWSGNPDSSGVVSVSLDTLTAGAHVVTLNVVDDDGHEASDTVGFDVIADLAPTAEIRNPVEGDLFTTDETVSLEGTVSDDLTPAVSLLVSWEDNLQGALCTGVADSVGFTACAARLVEGVHVVTLTTLDEILQESVDTVTFTVVDPLHVDDDGDGYTEELGDCDDLDPTINPAEPEICDEIDQDCDGLVNEDWPDVYESNDSISSAYNLGEVDSTWLWTGDSVEVSGLTLHLAEDEDWFTWTAKDEIYDDVDVLATVQPLVGDGSFVFELYLWADGAWVLQDSDSGTTSLSVAHAGTWVDWDDSEDTWAVGIYSTTWSSRACTVTYTLDIAS